MTAPDVPAPVDAAPTPVDIPVHVPVDVPAPTPPTPPTPQVNPLRGRQKQLVGAHVAEARSVRERAMLRLTRAQVELDAAQAEADSAGADLAALTELDAGL